MSARHWTRIARSLTALALLAAVAPAWTGERDAYDAFNAFCAQHFGAEKEEEVYRAFGKELHSGRESPSRPSCARAHQGGGARWEGRLACRPLP